MSTPRLLDEALQDANLFEAWLKVRANRGAPGVDGQTIEHFAANVFSRLQTLRDLVRRGEYRPQPLLRVGIPKPNGKLRHLAIPTVRDRVLQTAVARTLTPLLDKAFEHASYGYRSGHSVAMAVARVAHWRDQGFQWVVDADIESYFDNIDHRLLLDKLRRTIEDSSLFPLIELWLAATVQPSDGTQPYLLTRGVPQGSPLSPLLANLYLDDLDEAVLAHDMRLVRFADDFVILCRDPSHAEQALRLTEDVVAALKLRINRDKTRLVHFDEGFRFLGVNFIRNLMVAADPNAAPWVLPNAEQRRNAAWHDSPTPPAWDTSTTDGSAAPPAPLHTATTTDTPAANPRPVIAADSLAEGPPTPSDTDPDEDDDATVSDTDATVRVERHEGFSPLLHSLVIARHGVLVLKESERIVVANQGAQLLSWPLRKLDEIHILGNALVSTALLRHCATHGVTVIFSDASGNAHAALANPDPAAAAQRHALQWQRQQDSDWVLMAAKAMVHAKISNQITLLRRYNRRRQITAVERAIAAMDAMRQKLTRVLRIEEARGCEGQAAHVYYKALRELIPETWPFPGRRKRPPTDPINALLSFGYAILHRTMLTLIRRQGLDPYLGTLHAIRPGHAALASDLIEEFRAPIVDTVVLHTALSQRLCPDDFVIDDDTPACLLNEHARRTFVGDLNTKLRSSLIHPVARIKMDYHRAMMWQVHHYRQVVEGKMLVYEPFLMR